MTWHPLPHGPLEQLDDNLWCVTGSLPRMALPRRMTLVRLSDGRLVVHSAVALREEAMREIDGLGQLAFIVVPNGYHRLDAPAYAERYPAARVLCPPAARGAVEKQVAVHGSVDDLPTDPALEVVHLPGIREAEVVLKVSHAQERVSLVFNDLVFNLPHQPGIAGGLMRLLGSSGGPRVTRMAKWMMVREPGPLRQALRQLAETPGLVRLVVSHGEVVDQNAPAVLRAVADGV